MATRPSTAAILAAARAADGKRSVGASRGSVSTLEPLPAPEPEEARDVEADAADSRPHAPGSNRAVDAPGAPAERGGSPAVPPSVTTILSEVRGRREAASEVRPPSIGEILAKVREAVGGAPPAPPSVARMLGEIRGPGGGNGSRPVQPLQPGKGVAPTVPKGRLSTAEILAAARKKTGEASPARSAAVPPAPPAGRTKTADILAAARRQGAGSASSSPSAAPAAPRPKTAARRVESEAPPQTAPDSPPFTDGSQIRPKSAAEILATIRAEAASLSDGASVDSSLPSLTEMIAALRQLDARSLRRRCQAEPAGWAGRLRRWFSRDRDTHRGASI